MENAGLVALSRQVALRRQMDVIANNIANANTTAFKAQRMVFETFLADVGARQPKLAFVQDVAVVRDPADGALVTTGNRLDVAIRGEGYFEVETPQGRRYTRSGHFRLADDGTLVTSHGHPVLAEDGFPIMTVPGDSEITISADGTVSSESGELARLALMAFETPDALERVAGGLYRAETVPLPALDTEVVQGALERSNVEPIVEMTRMIELLRSYQGAQRIATDAAELRRQAVRALGTVSQTA